MSVHPDFSPSMLSLFLRARAVHALAPFRGATRREGVLAAYRNKLRRKAGISVRDFELAWAGRLRRPEPRKRLWAVLGHFPAEFGIVLTAKGQEP